MRVRVALYAVLLIAISPRAIEACGCDPNLPLSVHSRAAEVIFIGTVVAVNPGTLSPDLRTASPPTATFDVSRMFRGTKSPQFVVPGGYSTCHFIFQIGETWLVYAKQTDGGLTTYGCSGTMLRAGAAQHLVYLDNLAEGREQGIVYGNVLKRMVSPDGSPPAGIGKVLDFPTRIVAVGGGRKIESVPERYGDYQLVLPVGDFELSVVTADGTVLLRHSVRIANGEDRFLNLIVD